MATKDAYSAVKSLLTLLGDNGPLTHSLAMLKENLADAMGADATIAQLRAEVKPLETQLANLKSQTTLVAKEYETKTADARKAYDAFAAQVNKQSSEKQAYIDTLTKQAEAIETKVAQAQRALTAKLAESQVAQDRKQRELEQVYLARLQVLKMQEEAAQERVTAAQAKLNAFIKSLG